MVASYQRYKQPKWRVTSYQRYKYENVLCGYPFNQRLMTCIVAGLCGLWPIWVSSQSMLWWPLWSMTWMVDFSINARWLVVTGLCGLPPIVLPAFVTYDLCGCWPVWLMTYVVAGLCGLWSMELLACVAYHLWPVWSMTYVVYDLSRPTPDEAAMIDCSWV